MGNINPRCWWPNCECATEKGDPCKFEDPDYYVNKAPTTNKVEHPAPTADCRWPSCGCADDASMFENPGYYLKMRDVQDPGSQVAVVPMLTADQRKKVLRYVKALEDNATSAEVLAAHYRPEFDACWGPPGASDVGNKGPLVNSERALELKDLVLEGPRGAKQDREVAAAIRLLLGEKL